jgi:PfaB family protein
MKTDLAITGLSHAYFVDSGTPATSEPVTRSHQVFHAAERALRDAGLREGGNGSAIVVIDQSALQHCIDRWESGAHLESLTAALGIMPTTSETVLLMQAAHASKPLRAAALAQAIGNLLGARLASAWNLTGRISTVTDGAMSVFHALQTAQRVLASGECASVLLCTVDLDVAEFGDQGNVTMRVEAAAIVLKRLDDARRDHDRVYATLDAVCISGPADEALIVACRQAHELAAVALGAIGLLDIVGAALGDAEDAIARLGTVFGGDAARPSCAVHGLSGTPPRSACLESMAALIRAASALNERTIPAVSAWAGPVDPARWQETSFYVPAATQPWFRTGNTARRASIAASLSDGTAAFALLGDVPGRAGSVDYKATRWPLHFVPLAADTQAELMACIAEFGRLLSGGEPLEALVDQAIDSSNRRPQARFTLVLLGRDRTELAAELDRAREGLPLSFASGREWSTPTGSYFTPRPLGGHGNLAYVYPGASSSYLGLGRSLFRLFPNLIDRLEQLAPDAGEAMAFRHLYPRTVTPPTTASLIDRQGALVDDVFAMVASATSYAYLTTSVLREQFGLRPNMAFGYSIGETLMLRSLGPWPFYVEANLDRWEEACMTTRISGPRQAAREYWAGNEGRSWQTYLLLASPERVTEALRDESDAFVTMINTRTEVCIAGDRAACERVIAKLGCASTVAPFNYVLHSPPIRAAHADWVRIHSAPTSPGAGTVFYTGSTASPLVLDEEHTARAVASVICEPVDFPRLVERLYADGARIFVEPGPGSACSRWIHEILGDRAHLSVPCNTRNVDDGSTLLRAIARLASHRVEIDLSSLISNGGRSADSTDVPEHGDDRNQVALAHRDVELSAHSRLPLESGEQLTCRDSARLEAPYQSIVPESAVTRAHISLLRTRGEAIEQARQVLDLQVSQARKWLESRHAGSDAVPAVATSTALQAPAHGRPIWNEPQMLEFAQGSVAKVFGPAFAPVDTFRRRVRLPMPPLLLVSRVTNVTGTPGELGPSTITTEYDIPSDAWYAVDGQIPWAVAVESGQGHMFLMSYLGIDFESRGDRVCRLVSFTMTFLGPLPMAGQTIRYKITIHSTARSGDTLLVFFSYECFVGDRLIARMENGCAGVFSDLHLAQGRGIVDADSTADHAASAPRVFRAPLSCAATSFDREALMTLCAGKPEGCFGAAYQTAGRNPSLRLPPARLLMLDHVLSVDPRGGAHGLGLLVARKDLRADDWYFLCHFQDDPVLPGSTMAEGCAQLLQFYLLYLGLQTHTANARFQPVAGKPLEVRCRGQVTPRETSLTFRMDITAIGLEPAPFAEANVDILVGDKIVVRMLGLAIQLSDEPNSTAFVGDIVTGHKQAALFDERHVQALATGSIVDCFGEDYAEFENRRLPRIPNGDLLLMNRVVEMDATRRRPVPGAWLTAEYDMPRDPWYYRDHGSTYLPYSMLMEIGLQPCGFLSGHIGATLSYPNEDFYFRNLDGRGKILAAVDPRGKTIANRVELRSSSAVQGAVIEGFTFQLSCDGLPFYEGEAVFGYFSQEALARQVGLDRGQAVPTWLAKHPEAASDALHARGADLALPRGAASQSQCVIGGGQFALLDQITVLPTGGDMGLGYIHGSWRVRPDDWFFNAHFHQDPVMPGSLGVEAMVQALKAFVLCSNVAGDLHDPRFVQCPSADASWKYRGQIVRSRDDITIEVHVESVTRGDSWIEVAGNGSLWRNGLRIYAVRGLAVRVQAGVER